LLFVTRLDTGAPVAAANVSLVRLDNSIYWRGTTGADGIAMAPNTPLRGAEDWCGSLHRDREKDGDVAYVGSDWNEGISPWEFGTGVNLNEAAPLLRGSVFTDRGCIAFGEEVTSRRFSAERAVRHPLLQPGTSVLVTIRDAQNRRVDERVIKVTPGAAPTGRSRCRRTARSGTTRSAPSWNRLVETQNAEQRGARGDAPDPGEDEYVRWKNGHGSFLVAAYRRRTSG